MGHLNDLTLTKALDICRAAEASKVQLKTMTGEAKKGHDVHAIGKGKQKSRSKPSNFQQHSNNYKQQQKGEAQGRSQQSQKDCQYCGKTHPPRKCPAYGASCNKCGRSNHFASVCQDGKFSGFRKKVHVLDQSEQDQFESGDDKSDYLFVGALYVGAVAEQKRDSDANKWYETILIGGEQIRCKLDTGAEANVLPARIVSKMQNAKLAKTTAPRQPHYFADSFFMDPPSVWMTRMSMFNRCKSRPIIAPIKALILPELAYGYDP